MHLINYLQPIYASLVAGHVFCTSNGMLNLFEKSVALCDTFSPAGDPQTFCSEEPLNHTFSCKVRDVSSSQGKPAQFPYEVSFKEVEKRNVSNKNNIDG